VGVSAEAMFMPAAQFFFWGRILVSSCMSPYRDGFFVFSESRSEVLALCVASVCVTNSTICVLYA
jgi:hypothetical protein